MTGSSNEYQRGYMAGKRLREREEREAEQVNEHIIRHRWRRKEIEADPALVLKKWAERYLKIPEPPKLGQNFVIDDWQLEFLRGFFDRKVRRALLSIGRKNGKSALIAILLLGYLIGPFAEKNWKGAVTAENGKQAKHLRWLMSAIAEISNYKEDLKELETPAPGRLYGKHDSELQFLAADKFAGHAIGNSIAVIDEGGLLGENQREIWNAMITSLSGRGGKFLTLGIKAAGPMFAELLARREDDDVFVTEFSAPDDCDLDDRSAWIAANPALISGVKSMEQMISDSRDAMEIPANQPYFRAHHLNCPMSPDRVLIVSPEQWKSCTTTNLPEREGPCYLGFDAGVAVSMTAGGAYWPATGRLECLAGLPATPSLAARGQADGIGNRYLQMEKRGELRTFPGLLTPLKEFMAYWFEILEGCPIVGFAADRFKMAETKQACQEAGISVAIEWRSMVWKEASEDVRHFQRAVISQKVRTLPSLLMASAISDSALERDNLSNERLDRSHAAGKIDALAAAILAIGAGERHTKMTGGEKKRGVLIGIA